MQSDSHNEQRSLITEDLGDDNAAQSAISDSWARCRGFGLQAAGKPVEAVISPAEMAIILENNTYIRQMVIPELELLYNQIAGTNFMVAYADNAGVVLDSLQDEDFQAGEGGKAVIPGSVWMEQHRGTNALGLALHSGKPQIVAGRDHYFKKLGDLSCFAAPIFDHDEQIVGVIDATSDAKARNHHTLALVNLAARNVENRLFVEQFSSSLILSFHARHEYLTTTSVALIAVDSYGFIEGANANAKAMLSGLNLSSRQHFSEVFAVQFSKIIDQLRANAIIQIRDVMGSVVFMTVQHSILKRVLSVPEALAEEPANLQAAAAEFPSKHEVAAVEPQAMAPASPAKVFEDEVLVRQIDQALQSLKFGLPVLMSGDRGAGKTSLARELHDQYLEERSFVTADCNLLTIDNFERELFGEDGRVAFSEGATKTGLSGKLWRARGGTMFFDNIDALPTQLLQTICQLLIGEEERRDHASPAIQTFLFSARTGWLQTENEDGAMDEFAEALQGCQVQIPPLSQRSDFHKIARALTVELSSQHCLSNVAIAILGAHSWSGNLRQLRKTIKMAIANAGETVIREDIASAMPASRVQSLTPCAKCVGSPVRAESCVSIRTTWLETGQNVSLVARRLGVSRNTVYKHVSN